MKEKKKSTKIRKFILPSTFNLNAENFLELIDWETISPKCLTSPPPLKNYSNEQLKTITKDDVPKLLCHSQRNEFYVQQVTKSASRHIGLQKQRENLLCTIENRKKFSKNFTIRDFFDSNSE